MKNSILKLIIPVIMTGTILTGCQTQAEKVENAKEKVQDEKIDLNQAKSELKMVERDSINEYQQFKNESEVKITAYEKEIADLKVRIANEKKYDNAIMEKKLAVLEQKNKDMKKRLENYKDESKDKWSSFKNEFNHDMEELGKALRGLATKNT
jgi:chromosome segregation ATPase